MLFFNLVKAVLARGLFAVHSFVAVWRVVDINSGDPSYWLLTSSIGLLIIEGVLSIFKRRGREMKWFCPSVFLYLCCIVPPIWIMELDLAVVRHSIFLSQGNVSHISLGTEKLSKLPGIPLTINLELSAELWAKVLEQFLLVNLILGRWLLPKGELTRGQLSQLLLVYIGMAADIVELFEAFKEDVVSYDRQLTYTVLGIWAWSLIQFSFVLTTTKARKPRLGMDSPQTCKDYQDGEKKCFCNWRRFCNLDVWAIMTTIIFQDGPFLCLRILLISRGVVSYLNIFFTSKNSLVLLLQLYRVTVICCEDQRNKRVKKNSKNDPVAIEILDDDEKLPNAPNSTYSECKYDEAMSRYYSNDHPRMQYKPSIPQWSCSEEEDSKACTNCDSSWNDYSEPEEPKYQRKNGNENLLFGNSDVFLDKSRDSVLVAFSQNKDAPWKDVYLTLKGNNSANSDGRNIYPESCPNRTSAAQGEHFLKQQTVDIGTQVTKSPEKERECRAANQNGLVNKSKKKTKADHRNSNRKSKTKSSNNDIACSCSPVSHFSSRPTRF